MWNLRAKEEPWITNVVGNCVSAPTFDRATSKESKPSYALVTRQSPSSSKESTPPKSLQLQQVWAQDNIAEYRGSRQNCDISIEFMSSEGLSCDSVVSQNPWWDFINIERAPLFEDHFFSNCSLRILLRLLIKVIYRVTSQTFCRKIMSSKKRKSGK